MLNNIMMLTDGYKPSHYKMYPPELEYLYAYNEARGGPTDNVTFFGLQYILNRYMVGHVTTGVKINDAYGALGSYYGNFNIFNLEGWEHIYQDHGGLLPLKIYAVDEGKQYPIHTPLYTIENTCPKCAWLVTYIDTLLMQTWYPCTVASVSRTARDIIKESLEKTGDPSLLPWKLHDFGCRGVSSMESAAIGGAAHLLNFRGSDTLPALELIQEYYHGLGSPADSIPASEHSTIMSWGPAREFDAYENILDQFPTGIVACVSDTYNLTKALEFGWGAKLRRKVLARDGTLVVRPDSGDPVAVVIDTLERLGACYSTTTNEKGFKVLDPHIRVIQGDGMDIDSLKAVLHAMTIRHWSTDNVAFGMGGGLLQKINRDTYEFATKPSWGKNADGHEFYMSKMPTGVRSKWSQAGRFTEGLRLVYENGFMVREWTWPEVVANAA